MVTVYFKPNRVGVQEKYITATLKHIEVDVRITADVRQPPELLCARNKLKVSKEGVYKVPIKCTFDSSIDFDLSLDAKGVKLKKQ